MQISRRMGNNHSSNVQGWRRRLFLFAAHCSLLALLLCVLCGECFATNKYVSDSISSANSFSQAIYVTGYFNVSVSGTFSGTVTLQRSYNNGTTWLNVTTYTTPTEDQGYEVEGGVCYQIGIATGNYTSGTAVVRISQ